MFRPLVSSLPNEDALLHDVLRPASTEQIFIRSIFATMMAKLQRMERLSGVTLKAPPKSTTHEVCL